MYYKYCIMGKFIKVVKVIKKYRFWLRTKRSGVRIPPSANKRTLFGEFFYYNYFANLTYFKYKHTANSQMDKMLTTG